MKLEAFFEKFEVIADAPGAVAKMRELVLQLAVQGKLVDQRHSDGDAIQLLSDISKERGARKTKHRAPNYPISPEGNDHEFPLPPNWTWTQLGSIALQIQYGYTASADSNVTEIRMLRITDIQQNRVDWNSVPGCQIGSDEAEKYLLAPNDILIARTGGTIGKSFIVSDAPVKSVFASYLIRITPPRSIAARYVKTFLEAPLYWKQLRQMSAGTGQPNVNGQALGRLSLPLPPLAEQNRIVAKVNELMALCDLLEAQQQKRQTQHATLARASLAQFDGAPTPANLQFLFHPSYAISPADLRKSILTLAVQGTLAPNAVAKHVMLDQVIELISGQHLLAHEHNEAGKGIPYLTGPSDFGPKHPAPTRWTETPKVVAEPGDILITVKGSGVGKTNKLVSQRTAISRQLMAVRVIGADPEFVHLILMHAADYFQESMTGIAIPGIGRKDVLELEAELPPLAEQRRIVAKVEQLMTLVDALETQLAASHATAANILSALVAEFTGSERPTNSKEKAEPRNPMKTKGSDQHGRQTEMEPLNISTRAFVLRRFAMTSGYRSLGEFDCTYHSEEAGPDEASPICLVGLNGSGKSNLIEAVAEVFCFLELINLPWKKLASASSRYRENRHLFELEYVLTDDEGQRLIRVRKTKKNGADFFVVKDDGTEEAVGPGKPRLLLLPRRVIGYSSGLNETVSHPFLRTKTIYSEEVRDAAPPEGVDLSQESTVFDTRTLYMDYESNAAVIICNYIFRKADELHVLNAFTRVSGVSSFGLRFNRKRAGKSGPNSIVRLTRELQSYQEGFVRCAGVEWDPDRIAYNLDFKLTTETARRFREEFETAENLFMAMHKWSLLNALILSDEQRNVYLSADITKGALERPPSVPPSDRVFNIVELRLNLSVPATEIDYSGLSDGEHQFMQIIGTALLFSDPGTLFLFDEPESHFNPEWRTKFNLTLNSLPNARDQEYIVSTHSPFVVSGSRKGNVYKFERAGREIKCAAVQFETYGASFDMLLKNLFSIDSLIDQSAREDLERIIKGGDVAQMHAAVEDFAESKEKRRLYEAIIQKEEAK